jgi:hypothetical protein
MSERKRLEIRIKGHPHSGKTLMTEIISRVLKDHSINHRIEASEEVAVGPEKDGPATPEVIEFLNTRVDIVIVDDSISLLK